MREGVSSQRLSLLGAIDKSRTPRISWANEEHDQLLQTDGRQSARHA